MLSTPAMKDRPGDHYQRLPETMTYLLAILFHFKEPTEQQVIAFKTNVRKLLFIVTYVHIIIYLAGRDMCCNIC